MPIAGKDKGRGGIERKHPHSRDVRQMILIAVFVAGLIGLVFLVYWFEGREDSGEFEVVESTPPPVASETSSAIPDRSDIIARGLRAVVFIEGRIGDRQVSQGTGFILEGGIYILTNEHVIHNAKQIRIALDSGHRYTAAYLIAADSDLDLAVLRADDPLPATVPLGDSDTVHQGDPVIAIGYPLGSALGPEPTVTDGIISSIRTQGHLFQINAAINRGNSGGPLLSLKDGTVIGVIFAKIPFSGKPDQITAEGIAFAIPINTAKMFLDHVARR